MAGVTALKPAASCVTGRFSKHGEGLWGNYNNLMVDIVMNIK